MNTDPRVNLIVIEYSAGSSGEHYFGQVDAREEDGLHVVLRAFAAERRISPAAITRIHCEWAPGVADETLLAGPLAHVEVTYNFERPKDGDWERAFAEAERAMAKAMLGRVSREGGRVLPLVRDFQLGDEFAKTFLHINPLPGIMVAFARVTPKGEGRIVIDYVTMAEARDASLRDEFVEQAWSNLSGGLHVNVMEHESGRVFLAEHEWGLGAAAFAMPGFIERAREWTGSRHVTIGFVDGGALMVCAAGGGAEDVLKRSVSKTPRAPHSNLTPMCLRFEDQGVRVLARGGSIGGIT